jgi:two-component system, NarL family, sensor kinase
MLDRRIMSLLIAGTMLSVLVVGLLVLLALNFRRRKNLHFLERQRLLIANLQEGERMMNQIAKEVHDNIGQLSHLLYMTLDKIENTTVRETQAKLIDQARQLTDSIIFNADNISNSLNSDYIKKRGLSNILQDDIVLINSSGRIKCAFEFTGEIRAFYPDKELLIYRIAQEAIHNALKHGSATNLKVSLHYGSDRFNMEIKDDGLGFKTQDAIKRGIGLSNMKERANLLSGKLEIMSEPGTGCSVNLLVDQTVL